MSVTGCRLHVFTHKLKCNGMRWFAECGQIGDKPQQQTLLVFSVLFKNVQHPEIRRKSFISIKYLKHKQNIPLSKRDVETTIISQQIFGPKKAGKKHVIKPFDKR